MTDQLKIRADSAADVAIFSAALQDAILKVGDIQYGGSGRYLSLRLTRFRHEAQLASERILTGLRIDDVLSLKSKGIDRADPEAMAVVLSISFTSGDAEPGGVLKIIFAGGGELQAEIECIDMTLADVSAPRKTDKLPLHPVD